MENRQALIQEMLTSLIRFKKTMTSVRISCPGAILSGSQLSLLMIIRRHQPVTVNQAARELSMTPGAVSQLLESLETTGFVDKIVRSDDRRSVLLSVSEQGQYALRHFESKRYELVTKALREFSDEEIAIITKAHIAILHQLEQNNHITVQKEG